MSTGSALPSTTHRQCCPRVQRQLVSESRYLYESLKPSRNLYHVSNCVVLFSHFTEGTISIDLSLPLNGSFNRASPSWSTNLLDQYIATINTFSKYDNVLAYNVGNEVITAANNTDATPFVKAAARDIKAYL
jgi:hypothetical protein